MSTKQENSFHPLNQPYINQTYRNKKLSSNRTNEIGTIIPSFESERSLQYSKASSSGYSPKSAFSRTSTNLNAISTDLRQQQSSNAFKLQFNQSSSYLPNQNKNNQDFRQAIRSQQVQAVQEHSLSTELQKRQTELSRSYELQFLRKQSHESQQQLSTRVLHDKINYLEKELQQLTRLLHEESKRSYTGQDYEEVAIENAQLTIKVRQLEEQIIKITHEKQQTEKQFIELGRQCEKQHSVNNELREKIIENQQKLNHYEKNLNQLHAQFQESQCHQQQEQKYQNCILKSSQNQQKSQGYTVTLERQNSRLTEQIETLLSKLHNLNLDLNDEQQQKYQLMSRLNEQLIEIQKLRKQLSDTEIQKLQFEQMNKYLKTQIKEVNDLSLKNQKELQEKYIKQDFEKTQTQSQLLELNKTSQIHLNQLNGRIRNYQLEIEELKAKINELSLIKEPKSEPFKQLFEGVQSSLRSQILFLQQQLLQQKQRNGLLKNNYTQIIQNLEARIDQLETQNKKLVMENRTRKIQIQDKIKEINQLQLNCQSLESSIQELEISNHNLRKHIQNQKLMQQTTINKLKLQNEQLQQHNQTLEEQNRNRQYQNQENYYQQILKQKCLLDKQIRQLSQQNQRLQTQNRHLSENSQLLSQNLKFKPESQTTKKICEQFQNSQLKVSQLEDQLRIAQSQLKNATRNLEKTSKELNQKNQLANQLHMLEEKHQQLLEQVKIIKKNKNSLQEEWNIQDETIKDFKGEIFKLRALLESANEINKSLQNKLDGFRLQNETLKNKINKLSIQQSSQISRQPSTIGSSQCHFCPQILKQFSIYKQLMQLKFDTMNEMLNQLKISFIKCQFQMKDQIHRDKGKYQYWMEKYNEHDKQYKVLMDRLWQWDKISTKNLSPQFAPLNANPTINLIHPPSHQEKKIKKTQKKQHKIDPAPHLTQIQYDLYLIKIQNSALRSQISSLEKELMQVEKNPSAQHQIQQLKRHSNNLMHQNKKLQNYLSPFSNENKILCSKIYSLKNLQIEKFNDLNDESLAPDRLRYQSNANIKQIDHARNQEKVLAAAELLISQLKNQNKNLVEAKHQMSQQLEKQLEQCRLIIKKLQSQQQFARQQWQKQLKINKHEIVDRFNIPYEYVKYHPQHKKLQSEFVALKRSYLEMDLSFKKTKQYLQEQFDKIKIQNDFHCQRIIQLESNDKQKHFSPKNSPQNNLMFSFNRNCSDIHSLFNDDKTLYAETKIKTFQERISYLQEQVNVKAAECQSYARKYEELMKQLSYRPQTPKNTSNKQSISRIEKLVGNIEVSPIQSPQWQTNIEWEYNSQEQQTSSAQKSSDSAQKPSNLMQLQQNLAHQQRSSNLFSNDSQGPFDQKSLIKLNSCIEKKLIELEITPRQQSNLIKKATWLIERLASDIKQLKGSLEILKEQKKAIMKERNQLQQKLYQTNQFQEQSEKKDVFYQQSSHHNIRKINSSKKNHQNELRHVGFNKIKTVNNNQLIPKLHFDDDPQDKISDVNNLPNVIKETLELKNQRRNDLKKFQKQIEILTRN